MTRRFFKVEARLSTVNATRPLSRRLSLSSTRLISLFNPQRLVILHKRLPSQTPTQLAMFVGSPA
jgi:hypothetical protein